MRAFAFSFVVFFIPFFASAASPLEGSIVPACSYGPFEGACGFCDIFQLAQNLINFAVAFSVLVATIMFVYAGFLYFSASAKHDNIKKAHGIFWKVFIGFVFILGAWLIVSLIMSTLLNDKFSPWNGFAGCGVSSSVRQAPSAPTGGITLPPPTDSGSGSQQSFVAPVPTPPARPWCFAIEGNPEPTCVSSEFSCIIARSAEKTSGSTVSECTFQSPELPENTSVPQEASLDEQPPEDEPTTQQGKQAVP